MKVFISWSGERSRLVAEALRYWLPRVIQAVEPWVSLSDIEKGARWRTDVATKLEQASIGIICLTPENLSSAWLHFEAGALSKQQENTYVCTFLFGVEPSSVKDPLAQFQNTMAQRDDVKRLIQTINNALGDDKLPESEMVEAFEMWWPRLDERLKEIPSPQDSQGPQRSDREILEDIHEQVRLQAKAVIESALNNVAPSKVYGNVLSPGDIKRIANFYKLSTSEVRTTLFEVDGLIELINVLRSQERARNRDSEIVAAATKAALGDKGKPNEDIDT